MQTLRQRLPTITLWVMVWFSLFIGTSMAAPLITPADTQVICSANGGLRVVDVDGKDVSPATAAHLDCPLCLPMALGMPSTEIGLQAPPPLAYALRPEVAAHLAWVTRSPLPPRGPPAVC